MTSQERNPLNRYQEIVDVSSFDISALLEKTKQTFPDMSEGFLSFLRKFVRELFQELSQDDDLTPDEKNEKLLEIKQLLTNPKSDFQIVIEYWYIRNRMSQATTRVKAIKDREIFLKTHSKYLTEEVSEESLLLKFIQRITVDYQSEEKKMELA